MIRSIIFMTGFYIGSALILIIGSPLLLGPRSWAMAGLKLHGIFVLLWLRLVIGTRIEVRGMNHVEDARSSKGAILIASKHQSAWETFAFPALLRDPALIMKAELMAIPLYGWFSRKFEMIPIRREKAAIALRHMLKDAKERASANREIIIFPEGTRRAPASPPAYKSGVIKLYEALDIPCVPVALNSGLFWPKKSWRRYPGTIIIEFLPPILPGLPRQQFKELLISQIETATDKLCQLDKLDG